VVSRRAARGSEGKAQPRRRGVPFTVYFSEELNARLEAAARERKVGKSVIVREAVDRLLRDLEGGQLDLPLGL